MSERVWEYPRPPALVPCERRVRVVLGGRTIADSRRTLRVLETSHPPTVYIPPSDVLVEALRPAGRGSVCEWKGTASYWDVEAGGRSERRAAWSYPEPRPPYAALRDHLSFYPSRVDACWLGEERAAAQHGDFYGGWVTSDLIGPTKGGPGTLGW